MKREGFKKMAVAVLLVFGLVLFGSSAALADENVTVVNESGRVAAGVSTAAFSFTVPAAVANSEVVFTATLNREAGVVMSIFRDGALYLDRRSSAGDSNWTGYYTGGGQYFWGIVLPAGSYSVSFRFDEDVDYEVAVSHENAEEEIYDNPQPVKEPAYISASKLTITAGFTGKLKVYNGTVRKWKSSKKSVATVNSKGKVTAKKPGKATVTATLKNGGKLKCKVTVKANKYTVKKKTWSDAPEYSLYLYPYSMEYNKKGDLVIKVLALNNTARRVNKLEGVDIRVTTYEGAGIGAMKIGAKPFSLGGYKKATVTFTIPKSKLKKKKADLRNAWLYFSIVGYYYDL